MSDNNFTYPDPTEAATLKAIEKAEKENQFWAQDETEILSYAKKFIKSGQLFIDAGCGQGRLIPEFSGLFNKIIAIEPDAARIQRAKEYISQFGIQDKVEFLNIPTEKLTINNEANAALSSHIIQHIPTASVVAVIQSIYNSLKNGGLFILTTSNSKSDKDQFEKNHIENNELVQEVITEEEFNKLTTNREMILPVHEFSQQSLDNILTSVGFKVIAHVPFHLSAEHPYGRDILILAYK